MSDMSNKSFHEASLKSSLFKGRPDLYFCYLKSEKIAHAIAHLLHESRSNEDQVSSGLARVSSAIPAMVVRFAASEYDEESLLADLYEALSLIRLSVSYHLLEENNAELLVHEYESVVEKVSLGKQASPFLSLEDLSVPSLAAEPAVSLPAYLRTAKIKDTKGHATSHTQEQRASQPNALSDSSERVRTSAILKVVLEQKRVSIKDISKVVKNCSEKTIQRELNTLISRGLVRKEGERRWSVYVPN